MNANEDLINRANSLDFTSLGILDYNGKIKSEILTYSIYVINKKNSIKDLANLRKKYDLIAAEPSDIDDARMYSRKTQIDVIMFKDFIDKVATENLIKNEMFLAFDIGSIINSNGARRIKSLKLFEKCRKTIKKFPNNVIFTLMPQNEYMMRAPRDLVIFLKHLGIDAKIAQIGLSTNPYNAIKRGTDFKQGKIIDIGVKIADDST